MQELKELVLYQKMEYQQVEVSCSSLMIEQGSRKQNQQMALSPKGKPSLAYELLQVHPIEPKREVVGTNKY